MAAQKKSSFGSKLLHNAGIFNPVLVQAVGLCPVIAMATTLQGAALLAFVATVTITLSEFISSAFLKVIPRWVRTGIYIVLGGGIVTPFMMLIEKVNPELFGSLGIYLPIMAVNSLLVLRCERFGVKLKPLSALADGLTASLGYSAVLILVGILREILGSGSLAGIKLFKNMAIPGLLLPFGGFLMIGFAAAALRTFISAYFPKYLDKKQPKPGKKPKSKTVKPLPAPVLPDLTPEEDPFNFEEIAEMTEFEIPVQDMHDDNSSAKAKTTELQTPDISAYTEPVSQPQTLTPSYAPAETATVDTKATEHTEPVSEPYPAAIHTAPAQTAPEQQPDAPEYAAPVSKPQADTASSDSPTKKQQQKATAKAEPAHQARHIEFEELTYEEVLEPSESRPKAPAPSKPSAEEPVSKKRWEVPSFDDEDEELARLMNRSMDEVFSKDKEDNK